ncbi:MAG: phosphonate ABC transporter ATP-binding protein [Burkholderiales bacterium PBB3]|nr:MAG: phosphonate ABC transporter ATP-binding protein [Burkholderiales bacterium PBB3]
MAGGRRLLDIDALDISPGERVAVIGPNGAGKSTLLRLLSGFVAPSRGSVQVLGQALDQPQPPAALRALRAQVGPVMQGLHLVARLSALENALIGGLSRQRGWRSWVRLYSRSDQRVALQALQAVGMSAHAHTRADQLSGGERQKVAIARLLVQAPRLILADEPTAALDPAAAQEVCLLLAQAAHTATLISVVHSAALIPQLADRVLGLKAGRIVFDLPQAALTDSLLADLYRSSATHPPEPTQG